jgi:hypothetical protein
VANPDRPKGRPGVGRPAGIFGVFSYYELVTPFSKIVRLIVDFTSGVDELVPPPRPRVVESLFTVSTFVRSFSSVYHKVKLWNSREINYINRQY